ncbi:related to HRP1-subunit of cleavage factor I [Sporisorium reilianum f. sp. reilianum]|uniref:Related to HRP1-subunit of cleavage factor I n=1 Tax=Sporisorium reilianum f. sp. reilianum TaxID=72559 RepID=A0A2N8UMQ1_9BASI|nr:related to HRP1-subunit of cleavage factor I [Sporisorium reilianum f. sp. reilianum]
MASNEDTDDLYADLYGADGSADALGGVDGDDHAHASDEQDLIGYEEDYPRKADSDEATDQKPAPTASSGSFIPPPSVSAAPAQLPETGLQIKGSFIPPPAASSASHSNSDVRDLTPASHNDVSGNQQSQPQQAADGGGDGQNAGAEGGDGSANRSVMPHEMPEEGKMFIGGLNWDTTEDSLRRYFSQFGEVGHCTVMRDNMTGRSRGFAFLNFVNPKAVNTVVVREHYLDGKVIDPKRAIPRPQRDSNFNAHHNGGQGQASYNHNSGGAGGGGGGYNAQSQKLFVGGLPASVTPASFRMFFEQFGTLAECTCMMDRETGNPRGFGFLTYQDDAALQHVLSTRPLVFDGKEVDVKRAQSKNDPQSLQIRRQQRIDNPEMAMGGMGMQQPGTAGRYGMGGNYNTAAAGNNAWAMNPMMMGMGTDANAMAQMYQSMGFGPNWNPQMAWQQMMASMAGSGGAGMDMGAMMASMGGGMGMMGGMGNMSPPAGSAMSPNMQSASAASAPTAPSNSGDDRADRSGSAGAPPAGRFQRGGGFNNSGGGMRVPTGPKYDRERSPNSGGGGGGYRRERSPNRRDDGRRYDNGNRNRY